MENLIKVYCTDYPEEGWTYIKQEEYDADPEMFTIIE